MLSILIVPSVWLAIRTAAEIKEVVVSYQAGNITIPPPPANVKQWPVIGNKVDEVWTQASSGIDLLIKNNPEQVKAMAGTSIALLKSSGQGLGLFALAILLSGVFLSYSLQTSNFASAFFNRLMNSTKLDITTSTAITIRSVVKGVLGVSFIQSILVAIGLLLADIPYAGVWSLICLVLAVMQVGILPVCLGVVIYIWTTDHTTTAILLTIWLFAVGFVDNILKPMLMAKGGTVPMPILLVGSLGGFLAMGFIGLFTGAVILSLGYTLFDIWLKGTEL
jgi:predicted PurR-regulated permease PerM